MAKIQICVMSPSVTGIEHRKIEPITKHLSHCKKNQSSWPNQIKKSERNTKLYKSCIKEFREDSIIFIDNLIINPQFIRYQQMHRKRRLHRIDLQEHQGEHCIEDQRERRSHIATSYGPVGPW